MKKKLLKKKSLRIRGWVAATLSEGGEVYEFTDPQESAAKAMFRLSKHKSWLSRGYSKLGTRYINCQEHELYDVVTASFKEHSNEKSCSP